ncbi:MAG: hypothetical protein P0107_03415 [Nitrosomonas sp.]|nr:hypothetical protein [Nitrosomonas sp.]
MPHIIWIEKINSGMAKTVVYQVVREQADRSVLAMASSTAKPRFRAMGFDFARTDHCIILS